MKFLVLLFAFANAAPVFLRVRVIKFGVVRPQKESEESMPCGEEHHVQSASHAPHRPDVSKLFQSLLKMMLLQKLFTSLSSSSHASQAASDLVGQSHGQQLTIQ
eukprot:NODE_94_length_21525_cov_0.751003.p21 type:complete len:104 gc:universal NODE_94_length_21525_cov_0.751003:16981-16670(-)